MARRLASIKLVPYEDKYRYQVMDIARDLHLQSCYANMEFNEDKVHQQLTLCLNQVKHRYFKLAVRDGEVLGGFLGMVAPTFFSDDLVAKDLSWIVKSSRRKQGASLVLLQDFVEWAKEMGAKSVMLGQITEGDIESTTKLFLHLGYRLAGFNVVRDI